jgi:mRNA-degrading endonuclease RelE of RelBE toxin-antitoxin system
MKSRLVKITPSGYRSLESILNKKILREIGKAIDGLERAPELQGKALEDELDGCRSIGAYKNLYRIIYRIQGETVWILLAGLRKAGHDEDIYVRAQRLVKTFLS